MVVGSCHCRRHEEGAGTRNDKKICPHYLFHILGICTCMCFVIVRVYSRDFIQTLRLETWAQESKEALSELG